MNDQIEVFAAQCAPSGNGTERHSAGNGQNPQRQDLVARVYAAETALHHAQSQIERRDEAINALRQQLADVSAAQAAGAKLPPGAQQNIVSQVAQARCAELEQEVATLRQALEGLNGTFGQQQQGSAQAEAELRQQLDAAAAANQQSDADRQEAQARCAQLEQELAAARHMRDELANKLAQEQKVSAQSAAQLKELAEQSSSGPTGAPASDLELQVRQGVAALARATAELAQERGQRQRSEQRAAELNVRLQSLHQDLSRTLQAQHDDLARITTLEEQFRQATQSLEQRTADFEHQQAEHRLIDEQFEKAKELNAQLQKDVAFHEDANKKFEAGRQELQAKLEASLNATRESDARFLQEKAERLRLSEELDAIQRKAGDRSERDLEFSKLQSALQHEQVERNRKETQLAHVRHDAVDAAQAARALRTNLRRQVREPVDNLVQSARSLLELEMGDEQKKLAAAVLEDVLLVQTRLREPDGAQDESTEAVGT